MNLSKIKKLLKELGTAVCELAENKCVWCGNQLTGRQTKYCSYSCSTAAGNENTRTGTKQRRVK